MTMRKKILEFSSSISIAYRQKIWYIKHSSCAVRDRSFFNPHFVIKGCWLSKWFAGLPSAFCGWMLEAIKRAAGDPPGLEGAGYNGVYTAKRGTGNIQEQSNLLFLLCPHTLKISWKVFSLSSVLRVMLFSCINLHHHGSEDEFYSCTILSIPI